MIIAVIRRTGYTTNRCAKRVLIWYRKWECLIISFIRFSEMYAWFTLSSFRRLIASEKNLLPPTSATVEKIYQDKWLKDHHDITTTEDMTDSIIAAIRIQEKRLKVNLNIEIMTTRSRVKKDENQERRRFTGIRFKGGQWKRRHTIYSDEKERDG